MAAQGSLGAELASVLPPFDPLNPRRDRGKGRAAAIISILIHIAVILLFGDMLVGAILKDEEAVIVRVLTPEEPVPEPPKLKRKQLRQTRVDAAVTRFKDVATPEIRQVKPISVLEQTRKVEVTSTELTEAPKPIQRREIVTETVSVFAEVEATAQPVEVDVVNPEVRRVKAAKASAGPRKLEAGGPVVTSKAVDIEAPVVPNGVISNNAVQGSAEGPRIASLEAGVSNRAIQGQGERGSLVGVEKDCNKDPVCLAYLQRIKERVYSRWQLPTEVADRGGVVIRFRVDRGGSAHGIEVLRSDDNVAGETCLAAFRHANPFPPPPKEILYLVNKNIRANFSYAPE